MHCSARSYWPQWSRLERGGVTNYRPSPGTAATRPQWSRLERGGVTRSLARAGRTCDRAAMEAPGKRRSDYQMPTDAKRTITPQWSRLERGGVTCRAEPGGHEGPGRDGAGSKGAE